MNAKFTLLLALSALSLALSAPARADIDVEVAGLIGSGVATDSDIDNNPYELQLGAVGELSIGNYVLGVRGTRSLGNDDSCATERGCPNVSDLRTIGGDLGYAWNIAMLHVGPRLGFGHIKERSGDRVGGYIEPGAVAEVTIALFAVGVDLRYRVALGAPELSGFLAYLRLGLRI